MANAMANTSPQHILIRPIDFSSNEFCLNKFRHWIFSDEIGFCISKLNLNAKKTQKVSGCWAEK